MAMALSTFASSAGWMTWIGGGASASVHAATRTAIGDRVAVKILKQTLTDETTRRHFRHEVRALQELAAAPGIVSVLDSGFTARGEPYLMSIDEVAQRSVEAWERGDESAPACHYGLQFFPYGGDDLLA